MLILYGFIKTKNTKRLDLPAFSKRLRVLARKSNINKRIHPHLFRHSSASYFAKKMPESIMKKYFGWNQSSRMAGTYVHLNGQETDDFILSMHGYDKNKPKDELKPKQCPRCSQELANTETICSRCSLLLDYKILTERHFLQGELVPNSLTEAMVVKFMLKCEQDPAYKQEMFNKYKQ